MMKLLQVLILFSFINTISGVVWGQNTIDGFIDWTENQNENNVPQILDSLDYYENYCNRTGRDFDRARIIDLQIDFYFFALSNYSLVFDKVEDLNQLYEKTQDERIQIMHLQNSAMLFYESDTDKEKAMELFRQAYKISAESKNRYNLPSILNNYGVALMAEEKLQEARELFYQAISYSSLEKDTTLIVTSWSNIAVSYILSGNDDSTEFSLKKAYDFSSDCESCNKEKRLTAAYLGRFYFDQGDLDLALEYLLEAKNQSMNRGQYSVRVFVEETLSDTYREMGQMEKAMTSLRRVIELGDSSNHTDLTNRLWNHEYNIKLKESEAKNRLAAIQEENEYYTKRLWFIILSLIMGTIVVAVIAINLRLRSKAKSNVLAKIQSDLKQEKLNIELNKNQREVAAKALFLLKKDNLIYSVIDKLRGINSNDASTKKELQNVINELHHSRNNNSQEEFELRFSKVHPGFYKKLNKKFPNLTKNEKKLCAFLILDMSSKDISNVTGQSPHSINIARSRLRKKLGITNKELTIQEALSFAKSG